MIGVGMLNQRKHEDSSEVQMLWKAFEHTALALLNSSSIDGFKAKSE